MSYQAKSIRTFIGAKNYRESREFYRALGFLEIEIDEKMCLFKVNETLGFYLQDYYVKAWVNNSMILLEVDDLDQCRSELFAKKLPETYKAVRFSEIKRQSWGRELFMHDPSGVLWHFCEFKQ
ncbi:MAG TPA: glyoxalase [Calditrichia bacterium]|nr:hypothetical protein [Nitrospirales bacterium]HQV30418.1 glyoxalase [Calditrichia bacterium]